MTDPPSIDGLDGLPPLWTTDARDTADLVLPLRFACRWHALAWYPVERDDDVLYGLTLRTVPEWRHFHITELRARYQGDPVLIDRCHAPAPAPEVPAIRVARLDDLTLFQPSHVVL